MMNKREICRFLEKIGGFDTDLRLWIIEQKNKKLLVDFLKNNGINSDQSKDGFYRLHDMDDKYIYVKVVKPYRKTVNQDYKIIWSAWNTEIVTNGIKTYKGLKEYISFLKRTNKKHPLEYVRIYADNKEVCKSLWI